MNGEIANVQVRTVGGAWGEVGFRSGDQRLPVDLSPGRSLLFASVSVAGAGDNQIVAADATSKIKVVSYVLVASAAVAVKWRSGTTDLSGAMAFAANGGAAMTGHPSAHLCETAVNAALNLNLGGAVQVSGHIAYFKEA